MSTPHRRERRTALREPRIKRLERIADFARASDRIVTSRDVAAHVGVVPNTAQRMCSELVDVGTLVRAGNGWTAAPK